MNTDSTRQSRRPRRKGPVRRLLRISTLPGLITLGNLLCGFAATYYAAKPDWSTSVVALEQMLSSNLTMACYLVVAGMVFDMFDGRVARISHSASAFGAQLDSLADVVTFGVAPAFIVIRLLGGADITNGGQSWWVGPLSEITIGRILWIMVASYVACAALRLARFNVETDLDDSSHLYFRGLPSPGAAGAIVSLVLLHEQVLTSGPQVAQSAAGILVASMPIVTMLLGLLMVSRIKYVHVINRYVRGKGSFTYLLGLLVVGISFLLWPMFVLVAVFCGYALWGVLYEMTLRIVHARRAVR